MFAQAEFAWGGGDVELALKDYRDPLCGFVTVNEIEQRIIDTAEFQRLRSIMQLGTTFLVYPSATHQRFEHSLGVLEVSTQLYDALAKNASNLAILGWQADKVDLNRQLLRLAALLHDVGHAPFSHAAEDLFPVSRASQERLSHEDYTYKIITETDIGEVIAESLGREFKTRVAEIATDAAKNIDDAFLSELLTGDFGSDRIDYLMRDSLHLGVNYGRFDLHRLLNTICIRYNEDKSGPEMVIDDGGIHAAEGFILARYFMFLEVYFHKTRRILDLHLSEFLSEALPNGTYPEDVDDFLHWEDHRVFALLHEAELQQRANRVTGRKHFRLAHETSDHPEPDEMERFDWLVNEVKGRFGEDAIRYDEASKAPYSYQQPPIFVYWRGAYRPITARSPLVDSLRKITKMRLYAPVEIRPEVERFCIEFWQERERRRG